LVVRSDSVPGWASATVLDLIDGDDRMPITLDTNAIERTVRDFIVSNFLFGVDDGSLQREDSFLQNGVIDSTGVLELVGFLEHSYKIEVTDRELNAMNLDSIQNVAAYVTRKLGS
jgi:acyl carrier protein